MKVSYAMPITYQRISTLAEVAAEVKRRSKRRIRPLPIACPFQIIRAFTKPPPSLPYRIKKEDTNLYIQRINMFAAINCEENLSPRCSGAVIPYSSASGDPSGGE
jgi:hypothetical protein